MSGRGLALSDQQIETLKTVAALLPTSVLRERFAAMLAAVLKGRDSVGEGELARLSRSVANELLARRDREHDRVQPRKQQNGALKGFGVSV